MSDYGEPMRKPESEKRACGRQVWRYRILPRCPVAGAFSLLLALAAVFSCGCAVRANKLPAAKFLSNPDAVRRMFCESTELDEPPFPLSTSTRVLALLPSTGGEEYGDGAMSPAPSWLHAALGDLKRVPEEGEASEPLHVVTAPCTVNSHQAGEALGARAGADVVLWFEQVEGGGGAMTARLTLIDRVPVARDEGSLRWAWGEERYLDVPGHDPRRGQWLGNTLMALHFYRTSRPEAARARLETALADARAAKTSASQPYALHALLGFNAFLANTPLAAQAALRLCEEEARAAGAKAWEAHCQRAQGDVAAARGQLKEAETLYAAARVGYERLELHRGVADCKVGEADLYFQITDLARAKALYEEALGSYQNQDGVGLQRQARALKGLGDIEMWTGRYDDAIRRFEVARALYQQLGIQSGIGQMVQRIGDVRLWQSDTVRARANYEQALEFYRLNGELSWEAGCMMSLGNVSRMTSRLSEARASYEDALALYLKTDDDLGAANALRALGDVLSLGTTYDDARFSYEKAMDLYRATGSVWGEAACLRGLAYLERSFGVGYARRQYQSALYLSHKAGDRIGEAHSRIGLGQLANSRMDYSEAWLNFDKARAIYHEVGYVLGEARALQGMSEALWGIEKVEEAQARFTDAIRLFHGANLKYGEMKCYLSNGQAAMRSNFLDEAFASYEMAARLAAQLDDQQGAATSIFLQARLLVRKGQQLDATKGFERAREMYRSTGIVRNFAIVTADLGATWLRLGDDEKARALLEEASSLFEQIGMNGEADSCRSLLIAPDVLEVGPLGAR